MLSVMEIAAQLTVQADKEVVEFNNLCDLLEESNSKVLHLENKNLELSLKLNEEQSNNEALSKELKSYTYSSSKIISNGEKHLAYAEQAKREKVQALDKVLKVEMLIAQYKPLGTPKKIREQLKAYKNKAAETTKATTLYKKSIKEYRTEIQKLVDKIVILEMEIQVSVISSVYSKDGDSLLIFPARLTMSIQGVVEKQVTMLYMDSSGCGRLICLGEDNEPLLCNIPEDGLVPHDDILDRAGIMLRKLKSQNWKMTHEDLVSL